MHTVMCDLGIRTDEPAVFANSWAVDLPHERACPSVDIDFNGPCNSESDMDVRTIKTFFSISITIGIHITLVHFINILSALVFLMIKS